MSWLSKAFGMSKSQNPANAAMPYLNQIPGVGQNAYNPYIQQGQQAGQTLGGEYGKMLDPTAFMNQLMEQYKPSDAYQYKQKDITKGLGAMAAQGGYAGTPMALEQYAGATDKALSDDMQQYLQNALGIYGQGIAGQQDFYNKGFQGSSSLADMLAGNLNQQGGLAFQGQSQQNSNQAGLMKMLAQMLGGAGGFATQPTASIFGNKLWG